MMPSSNHPIWYIAKLLVVGGVLCFALTLNYDNGFDPRKDLWTLFMGLAGLAGFDGGKAAIQKLFTNKE